MRRKSEELCNKLNDLAYVLDKKADGSAESSYYKTLAEIISMLCFSALRIETVCFLTLGLLIGHILA